MKVVKYVGSAKKKFRIDGKEIKAGDLIKLEKGLEHLAKLDEFIVVGEQNEIIEAETKEIAPVVLEKEEVKEIEDENENGIDDSVDEALEELEENIDEIEEKIEEIKEESKQPKKRGRKKKIVKEDKEDK